jgi:hypothetical protein
LHCPVFTAFHIYTAFDQVMIQLMVHYGITQFPYTILVTFSNFG